MQGKEYAAGTYEVPGKGMVIGEGMPRVLVSASGASAQEILASAGMLAETPGIDGIELRLDRLGTGRNSDEILALAQLVNDCWDAVGGKLLVVTVRTRAEGGDAELSRPEYLRLVGSLPRSAASTPTAATRCCPPRTSRFPASMPWAAKSPTSPDRPTRPGPRAWALALPATPAVMPL